MTKHHISQRPLVIVEGFLGFNSTALWGKFKEHSNQSDDSRGHVVEDRQVIFASIGPVSSLHDRACELFYSLRGGTVDYGKDHSQLHGHSRFGRTIPEGSYPEWSVENPLNFFGHSIGGPTIIKLQWLLSIGFFGEDCHPDMVLSVTTISAPFRGTQLVYLMGEQMDNAPAVRTLSFGSALAKIIHVVSYLEPFLPSVLDFHTDSRSLSCREASFSSFLKQLWRSDWAEGRDAAPFDVTFQAAEEREAKKEGAVNPNTFYRSYAATMTKRKNSQDNACHTPSLAKDMSSLPLYGSASAMGSFDFTLIRPRPSFLRGMSRKGFSYTHQEKDQKCNLDTRWSNDGVVPLFSQWHPLSCRNTRCQHLPERHEGLRTCIDTGRPPTPRAGVWYVYHLDRTNHFSVAPIWFGSKTQRQFWNEMGQWLREIDDMWSRRNTNVE